MSCSVSSLVIFLTLSMVFHRQEKLVGNGTDENKGHIRPLTRMVRHRSLHGPIKINVSVSGSVAVSVSETWNHSLSTSISSIFTVAVSVSVSPLYPFPYPY